MNTIKLYTIGFTQKSAEQFFGVLTKAGVKKIVDARLNNSSQLGHLEYVDAFSAYDLLR